MFQNDMTKDNGFRVFFFFLTFLTNNIYLHRSTIHITNILLQNYLHVFRKL